MATSKIQPTTTAYILYTLPAPADEYNTGATVITRSVRPKEAPWSDATVITGDMSLSITGKELYGWTKATKIYEELQVFILASVSSDQLTTAGLDDVDSLRCVLLLLLQQRASCLLRKLTIELCGERFHLRSFVKNHTASFQRLNTSQWYWYKIDYNTFEQCEVCFKVELKLRKMKRM